MILIKEQSCDINKVTAGMAVVFFTYILTSYWLKLDSLGSSLYTVYSLVFFLYITYDLKLIKEKQLLKYTLSEYIRAALFIYMDFFLIAYNLISKIKA